MYKKIILFLILMLASFVVFSLEIIPNKNDFQQELKSSERNEYYKGMIFPISQNALFRFRTYGKRYIQSSLVYEVSNNTNIRFYCYLNITNKELTPAISIKIKIIN